MASNLIQSVRSMISDSVPGTDSGFNTLVNLGIRTQYDVTLQIVADGRSTDFRAAMDNHFDQVRRLFVPTAASDNSRVEVAGHNNRTQPGNYEIQITQQATPGYMQGEALAANFPIDTTGKDSSFSVRVKAIIAEFMFPDGRA